MVRKGKERRPGEAALLDALCGGGVQKVLIFGIDRVGRSLGELARFLETCLVAGASVYLHEQAIDTQTSNGLPRLDLGVR